MARKMVHKKRPSNPSPRTNRAPASKPKPPSTPKRRRVTSKMKPVK